MSKLRAWETLSTTIEQMTEVERDRLIRGTLGEFTRLDVDGPHPEGCLIEVAIEGHWALWCRRFTQSPYTIAAAYDMLLLKWGQDTLSARIKAYAADLNGSSPERVQALLGEEGRFPEPVGS